MLIPPCWFEKRASETEEQHAYIPRNFIIFYNILDIHRSKNANRINMKNHNWY